jgi:hypothetical protein
MRFDLYAASLTVRRGTIGVALGAVLLAPHVADAATVNAMLTYSRNNTGLNGGGSLGFNASTSFDAGIARVGFGARASSGDVDARASVGVRASYADVVDFDASGAVPVTVSATSLSFSFETLMGANATASVDFKSFLGINPGPFNIIDEGYTLETSGSGSAFRTAVTDDAKEPITGAGVPPTPGIGLQAQITLDASKESSLEINNLLGVVRATHESGAIVTDAFSIFGDPTGLLNLGLAGSWDLDLIGVALTNTFDTSMGLAASARLGAAVGFNCGDFADDDDNGFGCVGDTGSVASSPQLTLSDPAAFQIAWGTKSLDIGGLTVLAAPTPIPLPAAAPMLAAGFAALGFAARRRRG